MMNAATKEVALNANTITHIEMINFDYKTTLCAAHQQRLRPLSLLTIYIHNYSSITHTLDTLLSILALAQHT